MNHVSRFPSRFRDKYKEHGNVESVRWQAEAEVATEVEVEAVDTENREYSQQPPNELDMHTDTFLSYLLFIYLFMHFPIVK